MKVKVDIRIEFEIGDDEEAGDFRNVSTQFTGDWDALPEAIGCAIDMIQSPRPVDVAARIVGELVFDTEAGTLSDKLAKCAVDVIEAYERLDDLNISQDVTAEAVVAAMNVI